MLAVQTAKALYLPPRALTFFTHRSHFALSQAGAARYFARLGRLARRTIDGFAMGTITTLRLCFRTMAGRLPCSARLWYFCSMARRGKKRHAPRRSSKQHVDYAVGGILPWESSGFRPVRAGGGEAAILKEPRGAIREKPFAFLIGAFLAGVVGTLLVRNAMTPSA